MWEFQYKSYTLSKNIRIRREHFGGIIFNTETGALIEVDREAFVLLTKMREHGSITLTPATGALYTWETGTPSSEDAFKLTNH